MHMSIRKMQLHAADDVPFYLTGLFFQKLLQVRLGAQQHIHENLWTFLKEDLLQAVGYWHQRADERAW